MECLKGLSHRIRDKWTNEFRSLDWFKIKELLWNVTPLFIEVPTDDTALADETAFHGETVSPTLRECGVPKTHFVKRNHRARTKLPTKQSKKLPTNRSKRLSSNGSKKTEMEKSI